MPVENSASGCIFLWIGEIISSENHSNKARNDGITPSLFWK
jgi:hypothetical protein